MLKKNIIQLFLISSFMGFLFFNSNAIGQNPTTSKTDLTGIWDFGHPDGSQMQIYQQGKMVYGIVVNPNFAHRFVGKFTNETTIKGAYIFRRSRSNGCETKFSVILKIYNPNSVQLTYKALDSKCDWLKGQGGIDILTRKL